MQKVIHVKFAVASYNGRTLGINAFPAFWDADKGESHSVTSYRVPYEISKTWKHWDGFGIRAHMDEDTMQFRPDGTCGDEIRFRSDSDLTLYELEQKTKAARKLDAALRRMYDAEGSHASIGALISRFGRAAGCEGWLVQRVEPLTNGYATGEDVEFCCYNKPVDAIYAIDRFLSDYKSKMSWAVQAA